MKRFILMFTAIMFLANAFAVSAWAKPCVNIDMSSSVEKMETMAEMPCHEDMDKEQKTPIQHCDGICLCFHVSINQTPVLNDMANFVFPDNQKDQLFNQDERVASMATAPPSPPPKRNS